MVPTDPQLDSLFGALSDPTRRAILERLKAGEASVGDLAEPFNMSLPAVSRHIKILEVAGLVTRKRDGQFRRLSLNQAAFTRGQAWFEDYRDFWDGSFGRLAAHLDKRRENNHDDTNSH